MKRIPRRQFSLILVIICLFSPFLLSAENKSKSRYIIEWNDLTIETMKNDGINPVLATRIYLYPNIAAYEVLNHQSPFSFSGQLKGFDITVENPVNLSKNFAAIHAYYLVMRQLNYRTDLCDVLYHRQLEEMSKSISAESLEASKAFAESIANKVLAWADADNYKQSKGMPLHEVKSGKSGAWIPTPPEYRPALEPHWNKLRTLLISDFEEFSLPFEIEYSEAEASEFYNLAKEVYDSSKTLNAENKAIALFWDDNPDLNNFMGHIPSPRRHINPTAHWMGIIGQVLRKENLPFAEAVKIYAVAAIAFYEANLICWDDKYKYNLIRPVSYIQKIIDPEWMPLLVTPPFPEHTSGHSACSASCATVLSAFLGNDYAFVDSTHFKTGLGVRAFPSFDAAAWEVSISRFYGGIHYKTAVVGGTEQGKKIGNEILNLLELEK